MPIDDFARDQKILFDVPKGEGVYSVVATPNMETLYDAAFDAVCKALLRFADARRNDYGGEDNGLKKARETAREYIRLLRAAGKPATADELESLLK